MPDLVDPPVLTSEDPNPQGSPGSQRGAGPSAEPKLPPPEQLLNFVYVGRLVVAVAAFGAMVWVWADVEPARTLAITFTLLLVAFVTALSYFYTGIAGRWPGEAFRYGQMVFDCLFVTTVVMLTGGAASPFSPVYVLVICAGGILLPFRGGILIGVLASMLFFAGSIWHAASAPDATVFLQLGLFAMVALATGYLGDRLRQTGTVLGEVETQLHRLRLDTDEILDTINTGILTVDGQGRLAYINPAAEDLLGMRRAEWIGRPVLDELERRAHGFGRLLKSSIDERRPLARAETARASSRGHLFGVSTTLLERKHGDLPSVTAIFQDIRQKVRLEMLRRRAERLEAVANLSASLAHEIKNPLASIRSAAEQLRGGGIDAEDVGVLEGLIMRESDRLTRLLGDFLDFARERPSNFARLDIGEITKAVIGVVRAHPDAREKTVRLDVPSDTPVLYGDPDMLHRAILNVTLNGVQWIEEGGVVEVRVDRCRSDLLSSGAGLVEAVRIRVLDTGPGFPIDEAEQLFDPFFTRRKDGTGLGLAMVQRAVDVHRGTIYLGQADDVEDGWGGVVTMLLPVRDPDAPDPEALMAGRGSHG